MEVIFPEGQEDGATETFPAELPLLLMTQCPLEVVDFDDWFELELFFLVGFVWSPCEDCMSCVCKSDINDDTARSYMSQHHLSEVYS